MVPLHSMQIYHQHASAMELWQTQWLETILESVRLSQKFCIDLYFLFPRQKITDLVQCERCLRMLPSSLQNNHILTHDIPDSQLFLLHSKSVPYPEIYLRSAKIYP